VSPRSRRRVGTARAVPLLVAVALALGGCTEVETETATGYEPSNIEPVKGTDLVRVTFTAEGAKRVGLQTGTVGRRGTEKVVPYAALLYAPDGTTYVYTSSKPLQYLREQVKVDRIEGDRVFLADGPPVGTQVVTVGATEVYGTELEVASH
jgi:hypothetical protein